MELKFPKKIRFSKDCMLTLMNRTVPRHPDMRYYAVTSWWNVMEQSVGIILVQKTSAFIVVKYTGSYSKIRIVLKHYPYEQVSELLKRKQQIEQELAVFSDRIEELGSIEIANKIRGLKVPLKEC